MQSSVFLLSKFSNTPVKMLKSALLDFYDDDTLSTAKQQLLKDANNVKSQVGIDSLPHIPARREGNNKAQREVDDLFTILNTLDEKLAVSSLPTYVTDNPDKMPSTRLYEGDFSVIMSILEKMESKLNTFGSALSAISRDVYTLHSKSTESSAGQATGAINMQSSHAVLNLASLEAWPRIPDNTVTSHGGSGAHPATDSSSYTTTTVTATSGTTMTTAGGSHAATNHVAETQWSVLASTPQGNSNRFAALATADDDDNPDDQPYQLVRPQRSARSAAKRQRQQSAVQDGRQSNQPSNRPRTRAITGQSSVAKLGLWAAKKTVKVKKAFFVWTMSTWLAMKMTYVLMFLASVSKYYHVSRQFLGVVLMNLLMMFQTEGLSDWV